MPFISSPRRSPRRSPPRSATPTSAAWRWRVEVVLALDPEDAALAARVGRLQHRRHAHVAQGGAGLVHRPERGEARLGDARLGEPAAHRDLVRHQVRDAGADRGEPEPLGHGRDHGHGPVGADRQRAVDFVALRHFASTAATSEKSTTSATSAACEAERVRVAVDADDAEAELLRPLDRAPLVPARTDEEDRPRHGGGCYPGASVVTITSATRSAACPSTSPTTCAPRGRAPPRARPGRRGRARSRRRPPRSCAPGRRPPTRAAPGSARPRR